MQKALSIAYMACTMAHELYCPDADHFHVENGHVEPKSSGFSMEGDARVSSKASWNLLGGYVEFDMDTTRTQPSIISTFYTTSPEVANCGLACYCDINHPTRPCLEMDMVENNGNCMLATTTHTHATDGVVGNRDCDKWGCASKVSLPGTPVRVKGAFAEDGTLAVYVNGVANNRYAPVPSNASNAVVVATMERIGAVLVSSQWHSSGWVPGKEECPIGSGDKLAISRFSVSNLRVKGTIMQGPEPPKCELILSSSTTTTTIATSSPTRPLTFTTSPRSSSIARFTGSATTMTSTMSSIETSLLTSLTRLAKLSGTTSTTSTKSNAAEKNNSFSIGSSTSATPTWTSTASMSDQKSLKQLSAARRLSGIVSLQALVFMHVFL